VRLFGLPEAAPGVLFACPSVPIGTRILAMEMTWDLPSLTAGSTANIDVTVAGAPRSDFADASLDLTPAALVGGRRDRPRRERNARGQRGGGKSPRRKRLTGC
jgi:hypothetical protein